MAKYLTNINVRGVNLFSNNKYLMTKLSVSVLLSLLLLSCSTTQSDNQGKATGLISTDPEEGSDVLDESEIGNDLDKFIKNKTQNTVINKSVDLPKSKKEIQDEINSLDLFSSDLYNLTLLLSAGSDDVLKKIWLEDGNTLINGYIQPNLNKKDSLKESEYRQASLKAYYIIGLFHKEAGETGEANKAAQVISKIKKEYGLTWEQPISIAEGSQVTLRRAVSDLSDD